MSIEIAMPGTAAGPARVLCLTAHGVRVLDVVGVLDRRPGRLQLEPTDDRARLDATGRRGDSTLVRFLADESCLRLVCDVVELDHARTDLHPLTLDRVALRVIRSLPGDVLAGSCAVADITPALRPALDHQATWTYRHSFGVVFELCSLTGAGHDYDGSDTEWIQLTRTGDDVLAMVSLAAPLVIFFDRPTHEWLSQLRGWARPLQGLHSVVVSRYWEPTMTANPDLLTALYCGPGWRTHIDAQLFSGEDLWLAGT